VSLRYAVIDNQTHKVVNVVLWDGKSDWAPPHDHTAVCSDTLSIGDTADAPPDP
jgi:hypothetical protein